MRRFLCLFLALAVLVLCPLRVAATSVVVGHAIVTGASALLVVAGILYGLGVMPSSDPTVFETTRDAGVEYLRAGGHVDDDGFMEIIGYQDPTGVLRTYVSQNIIEAVRNWLFDTGVVCYESIGSLPSIVQSGAFTAGSHPYWFYAFANDGSYSVTGYSDYPITVTPSGKYTIFQSPRGTLYTQWGSSSSFSSAVSAQIETAKWTYKVYSHPIDSAYSESGLVLGEIAGIDEKIETGYETWVDESIKSIDVGIQFEDDPDDPNDDDKNEKPWLPVYTGNNPYRDTVQEMQSNAQSGLTDLEIDFNSGSDSDTGIEGDAGSVVNQSFLYRLMDYLLTGIQKIWGTLGTLFTTYIVNPIKEFWSKSIALIEAGVFWETLASTLTAPLEALGNMILEGIRAIFVPSADFLTAKVEAIRAEFAFADAIISTGEYISTSLTGLTTEPPVIYVNLGDTRGSYNLGGKVAFLDLRWYAEYKPVGDAIIAAFLWLCFAWRMYVKAPGIIRGIPGDFHAVRDISGKE